MAAVNASVWLPTPIDRVREYIAEGFTRASGSPHKARIVAHIPRTGILLSKDVELTCEAKGDGSGDWIIRWKPEPGGTYPSFEGVLSVSQRREKTILTLIGSYTPPLGRAGEAFDRIAGHAISDDAAHGVLMNIAADLRARYAFEEAIKEYASPNGITTGAIQSH